MQQVASFLTTAEQMRVLALSQTMSEQEREAWTRRLAALPAAQAATVIREQLAKTS